MEKVMKTFSFSAAHLRGNGEVEGIPLAARGKTGRTPPAKARGVSQPAAASGLMRNERGSTPKAAAARSCGAKLSPRRA
ncbi:MAG: hypothetical protein K2X74_06710 [Acetobacteraceae bacterium]|nr:hypothetical protein [Acetobacteraceae bacterium]